MKKVDINEDEAREQLPLRHLSAVSRYRDVERQIRSLIESGRVSSGERLPSERELSSLLGVNRSSIREALRSLATSGLVDIVHGKGVFVTEPLTSPTGVLMYVASGEMPTDLIGDLVESRRLIEGMLVELATEKASAKSLEELGGLVESISVGAKESPPSLEADSPFHLEIARLSGNRVLYSLVQASYRVAENYFKDYEATREEAVAIAVSHRRIFDRMIKGDSIGASRAMQDHINESADSWKRFV